MFAFFNILLYPNILIEQVYSQLCLRPIHKSKTHVVFVSGLECLCLNKLLLNRTAN